MGWIVPWWLSKRARYIKKMETALFVFIMKFDFNLNTNPLMSIESRFTRENTNDLGEPIIPQVAHIIVAEFKMFMFLNAIEMQKIKRIMKRITRKDQFSSSDFKYMRSPFVAPPYLDRFWKLFILYNKNYNTFWDKIWWSFIDRADPRENPIAAYESYWRLLDNLDKYQNLLQPFYNLWPRYNSADELIADYSSTYYLSSEDIQKFTRMMSDHCTQSVSKEINANDWYAFAANCITSNIFVASVS